MERAEWRVERLGVVDSTQDLLRARLESGQDVHRLVLRATAQLRGKGRFERGWESGPGGSYQSAGLRDDGGRLRSPQVPIALAVGIAEALRDRLPDIALKWPNDLYLRRHLEETGEPREKLPGKVGGILCQYLGGYLLIGVGLNVRNEIPEGAASIDSLPPDEVSEFVLRGIDSGIGRVDESGTGRAVESGIESGTAALDADLPARYAPFDLLAGRRLRVSRGTTEVTGTAAGVSQSGCLLVETGNGQQEICSGRIVEIDAAA